MIFIGTFIIAYRCESHRENLLATWAGFAVFDVTLMPTSQAGCDAKEFSNIIFVEIQKRGKNTFTKAKKNRSQLYIASGCIIVICILALLTKAVFSSTNEPWEWWTRNNLTFVFETFALWVFGFSWLVKSRFWRKWLADIDPKL